MSARETPASRGRWLDVVFALFLASGVMVGAYSLWAIADWIHSQGEDAFGMFYLGLFSFVPTLFALLAGGGWLLVLGVELWREDPTWGWVMRVVTIVEPCLYAVGITCLAARWFWSRRRQGPEQVAAPSMPW